MLNQIYPSKVRHSHEKSSNVRSQTSREKSGRKHQNSINTHFAWTFSEYVESIRFCAYTGVKLNFFSDLEKFTQENTMTQRVQYIVLGAEVKSMQPA